MDLWPPPCEASTSSQILTSVDEMLSYNEPKLMKIDENNLSFITTLYSLPNSVDGATKKVQKKRLPKKTDFMGKKRRKGRKHLEFESHEPFNLTEDKKILNLVLQIGPRFQLVSKYFSDRSLNTLKNRYYKYLRFHWDRILGKEYQHLNYQNDYINKDNNDFLGIVDSMNLFPEVTSILTKFVKKINEYFQ